MYSNKTQIATLQSASAIGADANGTALKYDKPFSEALIMLDVTVAASTAADTLNVFIDVSPDGGTTWINVGHFTEVVGDGGAVKHIMALNADNPGATAVFDVIADAAAGATRQIGISDRMRARSVIVDDSASAAFTFDVIAFLK